MIDVILILIQDAATTPVQNGIMELLGGKHILDGAGVAGPVGWAIHWYYWRRESKKAEEVAAEKVDTLTKERDEWKGEADKFQGKWISAVQSLISHGHESPAALNIDA